MPEAGLPPYQHTRPDSGRLSADTAFIDVRVDCARCCGAGAVGACRDVLMPQKTCCNL